MTSRNFSLSIGTEAAKLTEPDSVALATAIERQLVSTPLAPQPIATAFLCQAPAEPEPSQPGQVSRSPVPSAPSIDSEAAPILLLHGFDSSLLEFRRLLPLLSCQRQTWAIDLLGFGFTERLPQLAYSPLAIKTHLYACWQAWIKRPMVLVGASMGGAAAIDFALTYPEAVQRLVLIDSAGLARGGAAKGRLMVPPMGSLATGFLRSLNVRQRISLKAYHNPALATADALACGALHLTQPNWQAAMIAFTRSGGYGSFQSKLADLQLPTLILWGDRDRILGTQDAERFHRALPQSQLVWVKDCGHVPHLEQPAATAQAIAAWLSAEAPPQPQAQAAPGRAILPMP